VYKRVVRRATPPTDVLGVSTTRLYAGNIAAFWDFMVKNQKVFIRVREVRQKALRLLMAFIKIALVSQSHEINKHFDTNTLLISF
jgi:hypothetical protein